MRWLLALLILAAFAVHAQQGAYESLGSRVSAAELETVNTDLAPQGVAPAGSGTVTEGAVVYAAQCAHCHGAKGEGGLHAPLALRATDRKRDQNRQAFALDPTRPRVIGNYWPYATTLYDYIRRAMPQLAPGTLSSDEAYAATAYVLYLNGLVPQQTAVNGAFLQDFVMPARPLFYQRPVVPRR